MAKGQFLIPETSEEVSFETPLPQKTSLRQEPFQISIQLTKTKLSPVCFELCMRFQFETLDVCEYSCIKTYSNLNNYVQKKNLSPPMLLSALF